MKKRSSLRAVAMAVAVSSMLTVGAGIASAEEGTGAATGNSDSGTGTGTGAVTDGGGGDSGTGASTAPSAPEPAPAAPAPAPTYDGPSVAPDPPDNSWRANPSYNSGGGGYDNSYVNYAPSTYNAAPSYYEAPAPISLANPVLPPPPPMILPQPGTIRIGSFQTDKPSYITVAEMNTINRWSAFTESRIAQAWIAAGVSPKEADRRAATMIAGGLAGGAIGGGAGFAAGAVPGALVGAGVGALIGVPVGGVIGAAVLCAGICPTLPPLSTPAIVSGLIIGGIAGGAIGAGVGGLIGGTIGGLAVGVPSAAAGVALGSLFGGGDPNQDINQKWRVRDGEGKITPMPTKEQVYFDGQQAVRDAVKGATGYQIKDGDVPGDMRDFRLDFQRKEGSSENGTNPWILRMGDERYIAITEEQRTQFYKSYGPEGERIGKMLEDPNGQFQQTARSLARDLQKRDPKNTNYNPDGSVNDTGKQPVPPISVPYGTTPTPNKFEEPNRQDVEERQKQNDAGVGTQPENAAPAPAPAPTPAPAPAPAPAPVSVSVDSNPVVGSPAPAAADTSQTANSGISANVGGHEVSTNVTAEQATKAVADSPVGAVVGKDGAANLVNQGLAAIGAHR